jgi:preprotein translocase SecE subunit
VAEPIKKIPRIRKSAPTVRERAAAAQAEADKPAKPKRLRKAFSRLVRPLKKLKPRFKIRIPLPDNRFGRIVGKIGRGIKKVLGWLVPRYFVNAWREVRQVTWPGRRETWRLTLAVFIFALVFGSMVYGVDRGLDAIFKHFILKD